MATSALTYSYGAPSGLDAGDGQLGLSTFTPALDKAAAPAHPLFFAGLVARPEVLAMGMLAVAKVAAARYYEPGSMIAARIAAADPVVTCDGHRLRFESFSQCCGVHARLDVDPIALDGAFRTTGTTNVDVNPPLRDALARVSRHDPLRLRVGPDELAVDTLDGTVIERKVSLPLRWLKGFGETQVVQSRMKPRLELSDVELRRFLQQFPRSARGVLWAEQVGKGARLTIRPAVGTVALVGPERVGALSTLLRLARRLTVYSVDGRIDQPTASVWELALDDARFVLTLSPEPSRGFSGEGGLLAALANDDAIATADVVAPAVEANPLSTPASLGAGLGLAADLVRDALDVLAASGRVGFDVTEQGFFHRVLPVGRDTLAKLNPRLAAARALLDAQSVTFDADGRRATVVSGDHHHIVVLTAGTVTGATCTCPWYGKHEGTRGPCKHVLAAVRAHSTAAIRA